MAKTKKGKNTKQATKRNISDIFIVVAALISFIAVFFLLLLILYNNFVTKIVYDTDIEEKYRDYWKYSFGEYKFDYHDESNSSGDGFNITKTITRHYDFYYEDINGSSSKLEVSSYNYDDKLEEHLEKELEENVNDKLSLLFYDYIYNGMRKEIKRNYSTTSVTHSKLDESIKYSDPTKGIRFSKLDFSNLDENNIKMINIETHISIFQKYEENDSSNIKGEFFELFKIFLKNGDYNNMTIKAVFRYNDYIEESFLLTYNGTDFELVKLNS